MIKYGMIGSFRAHVRSLASGFLLSVFFEGLAVGFAEHFHFVLEAGSHGSFGDSSHGGCGGGGVDKLCPVPWTWEVRECGWKFMPVASATDDHKVFY